MITPSRCGNGKNKPHTTLPSPPTTPTTFPTLFMLICEYLFTKHAKNNKHQLFSCNLFLKGVQPSLVIGILPMGWPSLLGRLPGLQSVVVLSYARPVLGQTKAESGQKGKEGPHRRIGSSEAMSHQEFLAVKVSLPFVQLLLQQILGSFQVLSGNCTHTL